MKTSTFSILIGLALVVSTASISGRIANQTSHQEGVISMTEDQQQKTTSPMKAVFTCPMHSDVAMNQPGKCPKCGMDLVRKLVQKDVFACPMHPEVQQEKAGKCPKCGMNLVKKEPVKKTDQKMKS